MRLRLLERVGKAIGFSPEGREVRVWVQGMPGADETEVVPGRIESVGEDGAVLSLRSPDGGGGERRVLAVPHEPGWGLQALWFSFIAVDVFALEGEPASQAGAFASPASAAASPAGASASPAGAPASPAGAPASPDRAAASPARGSAPPAHEPLGRWFIRLGAPA